MRREKLVLIIGTILIIILLVIAYVEVMPYAIMSTSNYRTGGVLETKLYVVANTLLPVDEKTLAEEIIEWHTKMYGYDKDQTFEIEIYRTELHYKRFKIYDTIHCDANGHII